MKSRIVSNRVLTFCNVTFLALVAGVFSTYAFTPVHIQRAALQSPTPTPTPVASANTEYCSSQPSDVESIVREYIRLASKGPMAELERLIKVIPPKQPTLTEKKRKTGATVPNFGIFADLERAILLDDIPRWIAEGSMSIVSLKVELDNSRSARVTALLSSIELPGTSGHLIFELSENGGVWKINKGKLDPEDNRGRSKPL